MRLYASLVSPLAREIVRSLTASGDIEAASPREVEQDIESVLTGYLATEKDVNEKTRELLEKTGRGPTEFNRVRSQIAESKGIRVGEDMLDYLLDQLVETFHYSKNVDEIFCEDVELRRKIAPIFKRQLAADADLDTEVRGQLKHVKEGTRTWDIEYTRVMEATRRKKGLA